MRALIRCKQLEYQKAEQAVETDVVPGDNKRKEITAVDYEVVPPFSVQDSGAMPILFTKIQFHDHPAAFTVAESFLAVAAEPVSYTHLDVYKRQDTCPRPRSNFR